MQDGGKLGIGTTSPGFLEVMGKDLLPQVRVFIIDI